MNKITTADATKATTGVYAPIYDGNGNVTGLVNASCASVAHYEYGPFGEVVSATGTAVGACPFGFSTKYTDEETGLCYYGYRYYDPKWGRWLSRDPLGENGGVGLYLFINNRPVEGCDRYGLSIKYRVTHLGQRLPVPSTDLEHGWIYGETRLRVYNLVYHVSSVYSCGCAKVGSVSGGADIVYWYFDDDDKTHELKHVKDALEIVRELDLDYESLSSINIKTECVSSLVDLYASYLNSKYLYYSYTLDAYEYDERYKETMLNKADDNFTNMQKLGSDIARKLKECKCIQH